MKNILFTGLAMGSLLFASCGKKADTGVDKTKLKANEAVDNWKTDLTEGRVASLWDALPASYQKDVSDIIHSAGEKMDAEVYNEAMKTMTAATALLKNKKSIIIDMANTNAAEPMKEKIKEVEAKYDSIVGLIDAIVTSDAKDLDGLKKLDVLQFLGDIQVHTKELASLASLAGDEMEMIKSATATLVSESGDTAEVEMTADGNKKTVKLVKKEDRWIPADMANEWPKMIDEAKKSVGEMTDMKPVEKEKVLSVMRVIQAGIKELEAVSTKEEMEAKMQEIMGQMMGQMMGAPSDGGTQ